MALQNADTTTVQGTAIAEEKYNGRRVISVKTDAGGIIKIIEGMGRFIVTPASAE